MTRTRLPLKTGETREYAGVKWDHVIRDVNNHPVCSVGIAGWPEKEAKDHAAYIVKACNAYPELVKALTGASHALRSYQYGNASTELAQGQADHIDGLLKRVSSQPPAPTSDVGRTDSESA